MSFARRLKKRQDKIAKRIARNEREESRIRQHVANREKAENLACMAEIVQGTLTLLFIAAHDTEGLGKTRLKRALERIEMYNDCVDSGLVTLDEIEKIVVKDTKTVVDFSQVNSPHWQIIRKLSSFFLLALHDLYGFGEIKLGRIYTYATKLSKAIDAGEMTTADILKKSKKIPCIG